MWELIGILLLLVLGIVMYLALGRGHNEPRAFESTAVRLNGRLSTPEYFMLWPDSWLAIRSRDLLAVQAALSLHNARPCSWLEGFANADRLFIAPPVKGWILVTGAGLPEPGHDVDACFRFVLDLSRKLGEVQFFNANRAFHNHAWVRAHNGRILRAYAWAGTTLWQQGPMTRSEMEWRLNAAPTESLVQTFCSATEERWRRTWRRCRCWPRAGGWTRLPFRRICRSTSMGLPAGRRAGIEQRVETEATGRSAAGPAAARRFARTFMPRRTSGSAGAGPAALR